MKGERLWCFANFFFKINALSRYSLLLGGVPIRCVDSPSPFV